MKLKGAFIAFKPEIHKEEGGRNREKTARMKERERWRRRGEREERQTRLENLSFLRTRRSEHAVCGLRPASKGH